MMRETYTFFMATVLLDVSFKTYQKKQFEKPIKCEMLVFGVSVGIHPPRFLWRLSKWNRWTNCVFSFWGDDVCI